MGSRIDAVSTVRLGAKDVDVDESGFLINPQDWDRAVAQDMAAKEAIRLSDDHWAIIDFMRRHLEEHGVAVDARHVFSFLAERRGMKKSAARQLFFDLFPYGYVKQACKIAGLRQPRAWSTG